MDSLLRDLDRERSKMQTDIANLNRHYDQLHSYVQQYLQQGIIEWARLVLDHPQAQILVLETTTIINEDGYATGDGHSEPLRLTTLSLASDEIWDQLLHPTFSQSITGREYHGLSMADLVGCPRIADAWPQICERLADRHVVIFGADWSRRALQTVQPAPRLLDKAFCLHNKCREYYGEFYELSLEKILAYQDINKKREQLKDSQERLLVLAQVLTNLAAGMPKHEEEPELDDLDEHPF